MAVPISNVTRRIVFAPSGTGPYAFTFEILAANDIEVYKGDTLLTLTTDYTVAINANGTGSVTLVLTAGADNITIVGARAIERTTDFVTGGDFFANTVNSELDSLTIFAQQNAEAVTRSIQAPVTDPTTIDMTLPVKTDRAGKYLSFNVSTGNPEVVNTVVDVSTVSGIAADISTVSGISAAVSTVAGIDAAVTNVSSVSSAVANVSSISAAVSTVSGIAANVTTVAGISADVTTVATNVADITNFSDVYLGPAAADPTLRNDGSALQAGDLYFDTVNDVVKVYDGAAWIAAFASLSGALIATNNLSDLTNVTTAQQNLSLELGVDVQAYDSNLTSFVSTFTLPTVDGTVDQVLKTDGAGNISFGSGSSFNYATLLALS